MMSACRKCGKMFEYEGVIICEDCDPFMNPTDTQQQIQSLQSTLKQYREALEFYADEENWKEEYFTGTPYANEDKGHKARQALGIE